MPEVAVGGSPVPVPDADHLLRLSRDDWAAVLRHARAAMRDLEDHLVTPRIERLRAVPTSKLVDGRSRRELCRLLAEGGPLWRETAERLTADGSLDLDHLLSADAVAPEPPTEPGAAEDRGDDERIRRLKERARDLKDERDESRRRAEGLEARLRTEQDRLAELREALAAVEAERDRLAGELEEAAQDQEDALERQRRRHEAEIHEMREELRVHRRRQQQRQERRRRRGGRRRSAEERAQEQVESYLENRERRQAEPGRPSRLPAGVPPDTVEAVDALLLRGRRVLVDGYNVTLQHRDHLDLAQQREWLVVRTSGLERRRGVRCVIVFDGDAASLPTTRRGRGAQVVFTANEPADDRIVEMVDDLPSDEPVLAVTDDGELRERLRERGVDVVGTAAFLGHLR